MYTALADQVLGGIARPLIVVDWSDFEPGQRFAMLKAAVPLGGRAITVYERVFAFKRYNSPGAHREFLESLHSVLPRDCRPILLTDAGFRGPWFRLVQSYGWDWVGRIRRGINCFNEDGLPADQSHGHDLEQSLAARSMRDDGALGEPS